MNCTAPPPVKQAAQQPFLIQSRDSLSRLFQGCDHAQTMTAYSEELLADVIIPLPCGQWSCRYCAEKKIRKLAVKTRQAKPSRMLTLTVDPKLWTDPRAAFDGTRRMVSELIKRLRTRFGEVEYLRVTELTKQGWPHYHLLLRSTYIPQPVVKDMWAELTGAKIVDLRKVKKTWQAYTYLVKYLSKLHQIEWTERHVSYSKGFFPPDEKDERPGLGLTACAIHKQHPVTYCLEWENHNTLIPISPTVFQIIRLIAPDEDF